MSAEFLLKAANEPFSMSNFETILSKTQKQIDLLSQANTKSNPSWFIPPDKDGVWDTIKKNKEVSAVGGYSTLFVPVVGPVIGIGSVLWLNKKATDAQRNAARAFPSTTIDEATARKIIDRYDYLKKVISFIEKQINVEILEDTSDIDALVALLQRVKSQKDAIRKNRTAYLSYEVISPFLWEVNRQLFLADSDYLALTGKDKETLDGAVKILALACHKDWLYQADETVREQFIDTQRVLKEVASKVELEEYKVVTTLSDSIDPSKKRGADAWWYIRDPRNTGILAAWVAANTASPHTLPVVPPQNRTFNGVEITTAARPATQAVMIAFGKLFIKPRRAMIPTAAPIPRLVSA